MPAARKRRTRRRNPPGNTTRAGLGYAHQQDRRRLLAEFTDGDLCWRCGRPMRSWQPLDADHVVSRALGGTIARGLRLAHARCNRQAGQRLGAALRAGHITAGQKRQKRPPRASRW